METEQASVTLDGAAHAAGIWGFSLDVGEIGRVCAKWIKLLTDYSRRLIIELDCGVKTKASNTILVSEVSAFRARG